jgi:predicted anti-sigma-YlaC factor YlaD
MGCAALTGEFWAQAGRAVSREAIAAAKISQRGSNRDLFVIILGIPCLFNRSGERESTLEEAKGISGSR